MNFIICTPSKQNYGKNSLPLHPWNCFTSYSAGQTRYLALLITGSKLNGKTRDDCLELLSSYVAQNNEFQVRGPNVSIRGSSSVELQQPSDARLYMGSDVMNIHVLIIRVEILEFWSTGKESESWIAIHHRSNESIYDQDKRYLATAWSVTSI